MSSFVGLIILLGIVKKMNLLEDVNDDHDVVDDDRSCREHLVKFVETRQSVYWKLAHNSETIKQALV